MVGKRIQISNVDDEEVKGLKFGLAISVISSNFRAIFEFFPYNN